MPDGKDRMHHERWQQYTRPFQPLRNLLMTSLKIGVGGDEKVIILINLHSIFYLWFITSHRSANPLDDNPPFVARDLLVDISKRSFVLSYNQT